MEHPEIRQEAVRRWLPAEVSQLIDTKYLELQSDTYIDEEMRQHQSDRLIRTRLVSNDIEAFLFLLFEHKSKAESMTPLQLLRYMVRIWEQQRANRETLTPIIPIVFYHGDRLWNVSTTFQDLFKSLPEATKRFIPNFEYIVQDYSWRRQIKLDQIQGNDWYRFFLIASHTIFDPNLPDKVIDIVTLGWELRNDQRGVDYFNLLLYYWVQGARKMSEVELIEALNAVEQGQGEKIMATLADKWIEQGKLIGIVEGERIGIEKMIIRMLERGNLSLREIAEEVGLPLSEIKKIDEERK